MPGGIGSQFRGTAGQPGMQAGPAFETGSDASQNMNIQFRPLPTNLQGQPGRFDPSTGLRTDTSRQVNQNQNIDVTAEGSSSGQAFSIRKGQEASTSGPAAFQIVRVGSLPEFNRNIGSSVGVRMQGMISVYYRSHLLLLFFSCFPARNLDRAKVNTETIRR